MASQTNYIYGETLSGVVDGINKVFTSIFPIDRIEDLRLGGAEYSGFSFSGNTITLIDAPTASTGTPIIDYFRSDVTIIEPFGNITFGNVIDDVYTRLGQNKTSLQFPITLIKSYINEGIRVINNLRTNPKYKTGAYSFNKAPDVNSLSYSATEIPTSGIMANTPVEGKLLICGEVPVGYNGIVGNSFTSLSGLSIIYKVGDTITIGYEIPTGVKKVSEVLVNGKVLDFVDRREYSTRRGRGVYTIIDGFLFLPYSTSPTEIVTVNYVKDNVQLINDSDLIDIENEYFHVLSLYALYNALMDREDDRYKIQKMKYEEQLKLYRAYLRQVDGINNTIPSNMFKGFSKR